MDTTNESEVLENLKISQQLDHLCQMQISLESALVALHDKLEHEQEVLRIAPDALSNIKMVLSFIEEVNFLTLLITPALLEWLKKNQYNPDVDFGLGNTDDQKEHLKRALSLTDSMIRSRIESNKGHQEQLAEDIAKVQAEIAHVRDEKEKVKESLS